MRYMETIYMLDIKDIWHALETRVPQYIIQHRIPLKISEVIEVLLEQAFEQAIYSLTGQYLARKNYIHDACIIPYSEIGHILENMLKEEIVQHKISLVGVTGIRHLVSRTGLVILAIREL